MDKMNDSLTQAAEAAADDHFKVERIGDDNFKAIDYFALQENRNKRPSFLAGFTACLKHLEQLAGEFDEKACSTAYSDPFCAGKCQFAFESGARWQFEQDRARIGLAEYDRDEAEKRWLEMRDGHENVVHKMNAEITHLQSRLAEREEQIVQLNDKLQDAVGDRSDWE